MKLKHSLAIAIAAFVLLITVSNGVLLAHHSRAHYGNVETTMKGTIVEYKWRNPHVYVIWDVKDVSGKSVRWIGELASVTTMISEGMTKDSLKPGDEVTIYSFPTKAGTPETVVRRIVKADGAVVVANAPGTPATIPERTGNQ